MRELLYTNGGVEEKRDSALASSSVAFRLCLMFCIHECSSRALLYLWTNKSSHTCFIGMCDDGFYCV